MAIKYTIIPEQKKVIATLDNTQYDAFNKVSKICRKLCEGQTLTHIYPNLDQLIMPNKFKAVVICKDGDEFNEEEGKRIAKSICLEKYYKSFDKKVNRFKRSLEILHSKYIITMSNEEFD